MGLGIKPELFSAAFDTPGGECDPRGPFGLSAAKVCSEQLHQRLKSDAQSTKGTGGILALDAVALAAATSA